MSRKSKGKNLLHHKCFHCPLCDKGMITGAQFIDYVRMVQAFQEIEKEIHTDVLSLTDEDLDFLSRLKINPETEGR